MSRKEKGSFWPSYVDIMTTLFAITLILFAVSFNRFKVKEKQLQSLVDEYENIITVYSTVGAIDSTRYFRYDDIYLKHLFTVDVEYQMGEYHMDKLKLDRIDSSQAELKRDSILTAGQLIKDKILSLESNENDTVKNNIKFLVVIEGQSSKIRFDEGDWKNNYTLSYLRAQFLNKFWKENGIDFAAIPKCELSISGSGEDGVPRIIPDSTSLRNLSERERRTQWEAIESRNQRFLVHIVPVIGNIDVTKEKIEKLNGR